MGVRVLIQEPTEHITGIVEQLTQKGPVVWEQRGHPEYDCLKGGEAINTAWQELSRDCSALSCGVYGVQIGCREKRKQRGAPTHSYA